MTLLQLVKYLRVSILDDTGGSRISWEDVSEDDDESHQLRWTNEELVTYINEAFRVAYRRGDLAKDYGTDYDIAITDATNVYALHNKVYKIDQAKLLSTNDPLCKIEIEDVWNERDWDTKKETPQYYIMDYKTNNITFYPHPVIDDTVKFVVFRYPLIDFSWSSPSVEPELEAQFELPIMNYAAYMAYNKDEANTLDPEAALKFLGAFERDFPNHKALSYEVRQKRTRNRGTTYGGIGGLAIGTDDYGRVRRRVR